jgi:medium-chain acyl-[acyl-carrier-protein] hydrolase
MKSSKTFKFFNSNPNNKIRLFIFPFAGGRASVFKNWGNYLSREIEICCLQLPGREERYREEPYVHINDCLQELSENYQKFIELPYVFFGHSLGSLFCYEVSRYFKSMNVPLPLHVFLSGARPPGKVTIEKSVSRLNDDELVNELKKYNGIPDNILNEKDYIKLFLPVIRADLSIMESYDYKNNYRFSMPITVFGGESDLAVEYKELKRWNNFTQAYCRIFILPGDHFFIFSEKMSVLSEINRELRYLTLN